LCLGLRRLFLFGREADKSSYADAADSKLESRFRAASAGNGKRGQGKRKSGADYRHAFSDRYATLAATSICP
jgi:hypothetical protein